jgi:hypothetical protein
MTGPDLQKHLDRVLPVKPDGWPTNCCRVACDALLADRRFLRAAPGVELRWGTAQGHYWLQLPDGTILDPTAGQFYENPDAQVFPPGEPFYATGRISLEEHLRPNITVAVTGIFSSMSEPDRATIENSLRSALRGAKHHLGPVRC